MLSISRSLVLLGLVFLVGCQLELDGRRRPPAEIAEKTARARAEVSRNPNDRNALLTLAELQLEGGQLFEAADNFVRAQKIQTDGRVLAGLALTYNKLGYMRSTVDQLAECRKIRPPHVDCIYAAGKFFEDFLAEGDNKDIKQRLRGTWLQFLKLSPRDHPKRAYVISSVEQLNAELGPMELPSSQPASRPASQPAQPPPPPPAAVAPPAPVPPAQHPPTENGTQEEVGKLNPFGVAMGRAMTAYKNGDAAGAEAAFKDALKARPKDPLALAGIGEVQFVQGKREEAFKNLDEAFKIDPNDAVVRLLFGQVMLTTGRRLKEGIAAWEGLIKDAPDYAKQNQVPERLELVKKKLEEANRLMMPKDHPK